jgi:PKHD-type hydroxylase
MINIDNFVPEEKPGFLVSPLIIEDVLDSQEISNILDIISTLKPTSATINNGEDEAPFKIAWVPYDDETAWLYGRLYDLILFYNPDSFALEPLDMVERIMYTEFDEGDAHHWHMDLADVPPYCNRKLSITVQLSASDDYRGGDLSYLNGYSAPRSQGTVIAHPSYLIYSISPVTSGKRKALTFWLGGTKFR